MNARDWTTLVMRLAGVVLLVLVLSPTLHTIMTKVDMLTGRIKDPFGGSMLLHLSTWTRDIDVVAQIALGCYFLFGGTLIIKVLFRGLGGSKGLCPHCDYDLRGIASSRCPECGKLIRPAME